jgi:hypothetical protein
MEVASVLSQKNIETSLIIREDRVWSRVFTPVMSEFFERYYLSRGVKILKNESVASLQGKDRLDLSLSSGCKISCDMVVAGVGATPVTELFAKSGLAVENGIVVNEYLETSHSNDCSRGAEQFKFQYMVVKGRSLDCGLRYEWPRRRASGRAGVDQVQKDYFSRSAQRSKSLHQRGSLSLQIRS